MRCAIFSTKPYDQRFLGPALRQQGHEPVFFEPKLTTQTAKLADGFGAVCAFVNDHLDRGVLEQLSVFGIRIIALRCAGFNQVDIEAAKEFNIRVVRVPAYSPHAVAEHTIGLILCLNRKLHKSNHRVRENNFALDGLLGFDLYGKTVGVIGTGQIGACVVRILNGFGCRVLMFDPHRNAEVEHLGQYVSVEEIWEQADVITLHCPMTQHTKHLVNESAISMMRDGVMIVNTSRGGLVDTKAVIQGLKTGKIGNLALDVYEEESDLFFEDLSQRVVQDDVFSRLLTFPNVLITAHQAFFTEEALFAIATTTAENLTQFERGEVPRNAVA